MGAKKHYATDAVAKAKNKAWCEMTCSPFNDDRAGHC